MANDFFAFVYDCILFEHVGYGPVTSATLQLREFVRAFSYIAQLYARQPTLFNVQQDVFNRYNGLNRYYPHVFQSDIPQIRPLFSSTFKCTTVQLSGQYSYLHMPALTQEERECFRLNYANKVPANCQDDIALLIWKLRRDVWPDISQDQDNITVYKRAHNQAKVTKRLADNGIVASKGYQMTAINSLMEVLQRDTISTPMRIAEIKQFVSTLQSMFRTQFSKPDLQLHITGSYANGLCSLTSDVDVTLTGPIQGMGVWQLSDKLSTQPQYEVIVTIARARVPIVTFRYRDILCDISINQKLSIHNSKLVKTYEAIDPRVKTIWFSLKHLAKKNGILSAKEGFLSSYALSMMLITYLQTRSPPVLPLLQQQVQSKMTGEFVDGVNCSFDTHWHPYMEVAQQNKSSSGDLLVGFLRYFGHEFDYSTMEVNPRLGQLRRKPARAKWARGGSGRVEFWVMDPFLVKRNVAGMCGGPNVGIIKDAFQKAHQAVVEDPLGALTVCEI
ncbi:hypothetical protein BGZ72_001313 [Mortierella alpina]|nr:hypothetical protein BGZ72_001313 [Mortierella alpina]